MTPMDEVFRLQLRFWGVRGSIPTAQAENLGFGGNTSCLEVRLPNQQEVIIDGGTGLRQLGLSLPRESGNRHLPVLLTHFHWDHIQGIPFFAPLYEPECRVSFHSDRPAEQTQEILEGQMSFPYFPLPADRVAARRDYFQIDSEFRVGELNVRRFPLNHPQGASGYRLEREGAVLVHASDLEHGEKKFDHILLDHAQNADVLIYDAQYTPDEYVSKRGWGHSTWMEAVRIAREAHVNKLVLFHHHPGHDDRFMERLVEQARAHFENVEAAAEGRSILI
jgi:phosphoribosyl 1,2-cyclic phosphodiesterase